MHCLAVNIIKKAFLMNYKSMYKLAVFKEAFSN